MALPKSILASDPFWDAKVVLQMGNPDKEGAVTCYGWVDKNRRCRNPAPAERKVDRDTLLNTMARLDPGQLLNQQEAVEMVRLRVAPNGKTAAQTILETLAKNTLCWRHKAQDQGEQAVNKWKKMIRNHIKSLGLATAPISVPKLFKQEYMKVMPCKVNLSSPPMHEEIQTLHPASSKHDLRPRMSKLSALEEEWDEAKAKEKRAKEKIKAEHTGTEAMRYNLNITTEELNLVKKENEGLQDDIRRKNRELDAMHKTIDRLMDEIETNTDVGNWSGHEVQALTKQLKQARLSATTAEDHHQRQREAEKAERGRLWSLIRNLEHENQTLTSRLEQAEWSETWKSYLFDWEQIKPSESGKSQSWKPLGSAWSGGASNGRVLPMPIPWPVKGGQANEVTAQNVTEFFQKAPTTPATDGHRVSRLLQEEKRWQADNLVAIFGQDIVNENQDKLVTVHGALDYLIQGDDEEDYVKID